MTSRCHMVSGVCAAQQRQQLVQTLQAGMQNIAILTVCRSAVKEAALWHMPVALKV